MTIKKIQIIFVVCIFILISLGCVTTNEEFERKAESYNNTNRTLFLLTDDVNQELSVLSVEVTELVLVDTQDQKQIIFSTADGDDPFVLNLLDLDGLNALIGAVEIGRGIYKELTLTYQSAQAMDSKGNILTILPQHYGTAKVNFNPYLALEEENNTLQIDFDLNNSCFNIVTGDKGSLMFMPTLIVKIHFDDDPEIEEFKGVVTGVDQMSMLVDQNGETIKIDLNENTVVEVDEIITFADGDDFDLQDLIFEGNLVEVYGTLDVATATVTADRIERLFENHGLECQGIVTGITGSSFDILVLNPRDSGFALGSVQTISYDSNTFFLYTDPNAPATFENLYLGQDVRVTGLPDNPARAQKVKLKETKMLGTIESVGDAFIMMNVTFIEGISVDLIPGFVNPVKVEFNGTMPEGLAAGAAIKVEGHFNYNTPKVFTAFNAELIKNEEDEDDSDGEGGDGHTWVGKVFSVLSASPLQLTITRGNENDKTGQRTVTVIVAADTVLFEKYKSETTMINASGLVNGINSGKYDQLKAEGEYDADANTLTASKIRADIKK